MAEVETKVDSVDSVDDVSTDENKAKETDNKAGNELSIEEQLKAIQAENARYKKALDKATSEASGYKKELRALKSAEELEKEAQAENAKKLALYEAAERYTTHYKTMDSETAKKLAQLEADGDKDGVAEVMNSFIDALVKQKSAEALLGRNRVNASTGGNQVTKDQFKSMTLEEKSKLYRENKAEYDRLKN